MPPALYRVDSKDFENNSPDPAKYHPGAAGATMIPIGSSDETSPGIDPHKDGIVQVEPEAYPGLTIDMKRLTPNLVQKAMSGAPNALQAYAALAQVAPAGDARNGNFADQGLPAAGMTGGPDRGNMLQKGATIVQAPSERVAGLPNVIDQGFIAQAPSVSQPAPAPVLPQRTIVRQPLTEPTPGTQLNRPIEDRIPTLAGPSANVPAAQIDEQALLDLLLTRMRQRELAATPPPTEPTVQTPVAYVDTGDLTSLGLPVLGYNEPLMPRKPVMFQFEGMGSMSATYHEVVDSPEGIVLVYDTRCQNSLQFAPPSTPNPYTVVIGSSLKFKVIHDLQFTLGCLDVIVLAKVPEEG